MPGQRLIIEELGDVTVPDLVQVEVKHYSDSLTDGHPNFWNTLYNWTIPTFDSSKYQALVLHTTQYLSKVTRLVAWNESDADSRLKLLLEIHAEAEKAFTERLGKVTSAKPSKTLQQQRALLKGDHLASLKDVIGRILIEARSETLTELSKTLCSREAKHVLDSNAEKYINSLLGYVCRVDKAPGESWEIGYEEFKAEIESLTKIYCSESREFPRAQLDLATGLEFPEIADSLFISKIREIGCDNRVVVRAIKDYQGTVNTIAQEFREYTASRSRLKSFQNQVEHIFEYDFAAACLAVTNIDADSKKFLFSTLGKLPPSFPGYADSPPEFRNGVLHMMMDDDAFDRAWRLKDE
jgi:hypothetical protein